MQQAILKIARPYDEEDIRAITSGFERLLGTNIDFKVIEDNSLIGGFSAFIDGKVYNSDIVSRLNEIRRSFFN
ncbi:MAG: F0F1 ATP synthase subunit delta [Clostridiales bacterium]|nr:F0F1 ATP synthase subunit delta [Clostridiales bacterium]